MRFFNQLYFSHERGTAVFSSPKPGGSSDLGLGMCLCDCPSARPGRLPRWHVEACTASFSDVATLAREEKAVRISAYKAEIEAQTASAIIQAAAETGAKATQATAKELGRCAIAALQNRAAIVFYNKQDHVAIWDASTVADLE